MDNEIKRLLEEEIKSEIRHLGSLTPGEGTHSEAVDSLAQLYKLRIEELKIEADIIEKEAKRNADKEQNDRDAEFKERQLERESELKEKQIDNDATFRNREADIKERQLERESNFKERQLENEVAFHDSDADFKERQLERDCELKERQIDNDVSFHDSDEQLKKEQMKAEIRKFWFDLGVNVGMGLIGLIAYDRWYHKGLKFEETGTVCNGMIKNLQSKMLPKT